MFARDVRVRLMSSEFRVKNTALVTLNLQLELFH